MNIPCIGQNEALFDNDIRMIGWSVADRNCWANIASYGVGITVGSIGVAEEFTFSPMPKTILITAELGRLAVSLGHLARVNLLVKSRSGSQILALFKAAGRMAFSLYFMQQFIALYLLFAPFGLGLWGKFSWSELTVIATGVAVCLLLFANLYMRFFVAGPLEWLWRSLASVRWQPLRKRGVVPT